MFVRPFPDVEGGHWQISTGGGSQPLWSRNSQELFYLAPSGAVMSVRLDRGSTWSGGTHAKVFEVRYFSGPGAGGGSGRTYDVSADGQKFLMIKQAGTSDPTAGPAGLIVVQNWTEELKKLAPRR